MNDKEKIKVCYYNLYTNLIILIKESESQMDYESYLKFKKALLLIKSGVNKIEDS